MSYEEGYVGFSTEVRMSPKPLSHAQVGFEPTYAIYRGSTIELLSDEVWCEPVHCSLFFQYHHDTCTTAEPNHIYRTHALFYAGTLIGARCQLCY